MVKIYKKWLTQIGEPLEVELIEFVEYVRASNNQIRKFEHEGKNYIGEIWKVKYPDNTYGLETIRESYFENSNEEVGYPYNKTPLLDNTPNPLVDDYNTVEAFNNNQITSYIRRNRKRHFPNVQLQDRIIKEKEYKSKLYSLLKHEDLFIRNLARLKLQFLNHPSIKLFNQLKKTDQTKLIELVYENK